MSQVSRKVRTPQLPLYSEIRQLLRIWDGESMAAVHGLLQTMQEQVGTPRSPMNWSNPESWIDKRLDGDHARLARKIFAESNGGINPRHVYGHYLFINNNDLLVKNVFGDYQLSPRGRAFLENDDHLLRELDELEGIPQLLAILAGKTRAKRNALLPEWQAFLREHSGFCAPATTRETLRLRLANLIERGYCDREGLHYIITKNGIDYADSFTAANFDRKREVVQAVKSYNTAQLQLLQNHLATLSPHQFEHLILEFLAALGYEDIQIIRESGSQGFEVVAHTSFGIAEVVEVFHLLRQLDNTGIAALARLQEALTRYGCSRGTLLSLGKFTKECREAAEKGLPSLRLFDGDHFLALLAENRLGIRLQQLQIMQFDEEYFTRDNT